MWGKVTYREKTAVARMNEIEGRVGKPSSGGDVVNLEHDVVRRGPCGNRGCIEILNTLR